MTSFLVIDIDTVAVIVFVAVIVAVLVHVFVLAVI